VDGPARVWIDLSNSPHPVLFEPIVAKLRDGGHDVVLSARDHAQTLALARERWPEVEVARRRPGRSRGVPPRLPASRGADASTSLFHTIRTPRRWPPGCSAFHA
jgi:hypothetical protein